VAVVHGLGSGSDVRAGWLLAITLACAAAVWIAVFLRVIKVAPGPRLASFVTLAAVPMAAALWLPQGPLAKGWAKRAGTPARLLPASDVTKSPPAGNARPASSFPVPFSAYLSGSSTQTTDASGLARVELAMRLTGGAQGAANLVLEGPALPSGGVSVQASRVTIGPVSDPTRYSGRVITLNGTTVVADVSDRAGNSLRVEFRIAFEQSRVAGTVSVVRG
jgi:hypothetical protein